MDPSKDYEETIMVEILYKRKKAGLVKRKLPSAKKTKTKLKYNDYKQNVFGFGSSYGMSFILAWKLFSFLVELLALKTTITKDSGRISFFFLFIFPILWLVWLSAERMQILKHHEDERIQKKEMSALKNSCCYLQHCQRNWKKIKWKKDSKKLWFNFCVYASCLFFIFFCSFSSWLQIDYLFVVTKWFLDWLFQLKWADVKT